MVTAIVTLTLTRPSGSASEEVLSGGAVAALSLPGAVPYGLHSCWLPYEELPGRGPGP